MIFDLRHGSWQTVLADVQEVDAAIFDAPYSAKVHEGNEDLRIRDDLGYAYMTPEQVREHVAHWSPRVRGWFCSITCHVLAPVWSAALEAHGRLVFAPLPIVARGMTVRLQGDGPSSWTCWLVVARPRTKAMAKWGTLPGAYLRGAGDVRSGRRGGKYEGTMRAIVRDYSRPGDLVLDTHAGEGTTGIAAIQEGRRFVGAELEREAWQAAQDRAQPHLARAEALVGVESGRTLGLLGIA
jgi:site-specific DNA-methyltransferase (adenine-specific)